MKLTTKTDIDDVNQDVEYLNDLLDTQQVASMFNVSKVSINVWRRTQRLPYVRIPGEGRDTIRFRKAKVGQWARAHGKRIYIV